MRKLYFTFCFSIASLTSFSQIPFEKRILLDSVALHPHIADINKDGLNDLVIVSNYVDKKGDDATNIKNICWLEAPDYKYHLIQQLVYRSDGFAIADIDNDGWEDVIGADDIDGNDDNENGGLFWLKNPGNKHSGEWKYYRIGFTPYPKDILVSDFDGDGKKDVLSRSAAHRIDMFFQDGKDQFIKKIIQAPPYDGTALLDVDRDGNIDVAINGCWMQNPGKNRNAEWLKFDYDSSWYTMSDNGKTKWYHNNCRVTTGDLDNDGLTDIIISSGETHGYPINWYKAPADPFTGKWITNTIGSSDYCHTLRTGDIDNDGDLDVIAGELIIWNDPTPETTPHNLTIYLNEGNASSWKKQLLDNKGIYSGIIGDFDNDGDLDIIGPRNYNRSPLQLWENKTSDNKLSLSLWKYIQIDSTRAKWGDFDQPPWLRYFGIDAKDINDDGYADIVSGRYVYISPKDNLSNKWKRIDLGNNVDGMLLLNVDDDDLPDIIGEALPDVYWLEATDKTLSQWNKTKIGTITATDHINGQGYLKAQIIPGDKPEILLNGGDGLYMFQIPSDPLKGNWPKTLISKREIIDEGIDAGDIDNDGDMDIISARSNGNGPKSIVWLENPGKEKETTEGWEEHLVCTTDFWPDRIKCADFNNDGLMDIAVTEERYPGLEPDASMFWFEQRKEFGSVLWIRHTIVTQYSMNNLDVADVDHDGDMDFITNEHKGDKHETQIWVNDGKGNFNKVVVDTGKENHLGTRLFDLDNDGDLDIIGAGWDNYEFLHVWRNDAIDARVKIKESADEGQACFEIQTPTATYYYQKEAGGFSSIIDKYGFDWIGFRNSGHPPTLASAASNYRGMPNLVDGEPGEGTGHPGFAKCNSIQINANIIETESKDGKWKWRWYFFEQYAEFEMLKFDESRRYWFLYEGVINGKFKPKQQSWGNDRDGLRKDKPDFLENEGLAGNWQYIFLGDNKGKNTFVIGAGENDKFEDRFGFMGNSKKGLSSNDGMIVFGFGRGKNVRPLLDKPMKFYIGFLNENILSNDFSTKLAGHIQIFHGK